MNAGKPTIAMAMDNIIITFPASTWLSIEYGMNITSLDTNSKAPKRPMTAFIKTKLKITNVVGIILTAIRPRDPEMINDAC
jgi:hypothetical protein